MRVLKEKKCRVCKNLFQPRNGFQVACNAKCALGIVKEKARKKLAKDTRKRKEALKDKRDWIKEVQVEFNKFIRERDKNEPCISCASNPNDLNLLTGSRWDAGHYLSIGARANLRFNEDNCQKQCVKCNRDLSGNAAEYRIGLVKKIGLERVEKLESTYESVRYTIDQLKAMKELYKLKKRNLDD